MKHRILLAFFIIIGLIEGAIAGQIVYRNYLASLGQGKNQPTIVQPVKEILIPKRIIIESLDIDAEIEAVGLDKNGSMAVPSSPWATGWYKYGATLDQKGSVVIGGHLDSKTGPAIFYRLSQIALGSEIVVIDQKGEKHFFTVTRKETYNEENFPSKEIFTTSDKKRLNLITCRGTFDKIKQKYDKRIVIFTESKNN
ncbi:MAG: class F sortase [Patescibacteria group bacterium]